MYRPPHTISSKAVNLVAEIVELTTHPIIRDVARMPRLNRADRIRSIHSSVAIEGNPLSLEQVTDIIGGKRVLGNPRSILEVKNAYRCYESLIDFDPCDSNDLLKAHSIMMDGLTDDAGRFRSGGVSVFAGDTMIHMAPPADLVPQHVADLLDWLRGSDEHPLIKSCVFHYESRC